MQITVTDQQILITADAGAWSDSDFDDAVRQHGLWDEFITVTHYEIVDGTENWILTRGES